MVLCACGCISQSSNTSQIITTRPIVQVPRQHIRKADYFLISSNILPQRTSTLDTLPTYLHTSSSPGTSYTGHSSSSQIASLGAESPSNTSTRDAAVSTDLEGSCNNQPIEASSSSSSPFDVDLYLESLATDNQAVEYLTSAMDPPKNAKPSLGNRDVRPSLLPSESVANYSPSQPQLSPTNPIPTKAIQRGQRVQIDHYRLRNLCDNPASPLDSNRRKLLTYILSSHFYLADLPDPELGTDESSNILRHLEETQGATFPQHRVKKGTSLLALLTDPTQRKCLICEGEKTTAPRAVECVRSHLGYRPFRCRGAHQGCPTCRPGEGPMRFFSQRLLKEHLDSSRRVICSESNCGANLCRKGFRRHWATMHPGLPFPDK